MLKDNFPSVALVAVGLLALLGVLSKSISDYFIGIRASRSSVLQATDKAQADRITLLEGYAERNRTSIDALEKQYIESERNLSKALLRVDQLEYANADLIRQNSEFIRQNDAFKTENKQIPILQGMVKQLQDRYGELEANVTKNSELLGNTGN